ncbi:hypothetical protein [Emticicia agri]|uniref:Outer membrane protein beta-barrel domain-containing protein n=1 Tax=Emticicia agri TaxID=2492393 RepID=A0A4Q5M144_9BACT|nr:hypothetical protein [Emticicia agri]RYU96006.1 hypothetical protein EWM59_08905 [Emticicia agri]
MEFQKQNNFEDEWRKAFENASVPPSDELWGRIESELDKKKKRSPFLFFLKPSFMATGLAAALALVLGGILFFNKSEKTNIDVAQNPASVTQDTGMATTTQPTDKKLAGEMRLAEQEVLASAEAIHEVSNTKEAKAKNSNKSAFENQNSIASINARSTQSKIAPLPKASDTQRVVVAHNSIATNNPDKTTNSLSSPLIAEALPDTKVALASVNNLEGKKYRYFGSSYTMNRNKLAFDAEIIENTENRDLASNDSKVWVGLQSGVAPFDPNMKFGSLNSLAYSSANEYAQLANGASASPGDKMQVSRPQNDIKAGLAINSGVAVGYKIAKKWHVESGVRYLRGNSTLETNTYSFQTNGYVNTFLGDYLLQNSAKDYSFAGVSNTVVADASKFGNRYEYLMVPMQVGYEIGLTKKLGLNVLAGFSTDIFLQNSIFTDNGLVRGKNTISNDNKIYKPVNFSGLGGLRASYLISKHWQANIGTSYQRALFSGMNSSVDLNMRLQMFGINYGFNYRF